VSRTWEQALAESPLTPADLETIPFTLLVPDCPATFMEHKRCVVHIARRSAEAMQEFLGRSLRIDLDVVIAGAILADVGKLLEFHRGHGKLATVTAVRPPARFGGLSFEGDHVTHFVEKPQIGEGWINGGFFVLEPQVLDYIDGDDTPFEHEPLERLAAEGQLVAHRHDGFWQCMDTLRDVRLLESLWQSGDVPWKIWDR